MIPDEMARPRNAVCRQVFIADILQTKSPSALYMTQPLPPSRPHTDTCTSQHTTTQTHAPPPVPPKSSSVRFGTFEPTIPGVGGLAVQT
jgi:hypothetical protein